MLYVWANVQRRIPYSADRPIMPTLIGMPIGGHDAAE
jgi:hypothetical protein